MLCGVVVLCCAVLYDIQPLSNSKMDSREREREREKYTPTAYFSHIHYKCVWPMRHKRNCARNDNTDNNVKLEERFSDPHISHTTRTHIFIVIRLRNYLFYHRSDPIINYFSHHYCHRHST